MEPLKFDANYSRWKERFNTEKIYTRRDMREALDKLEQELKVNRVIQSLTGKVGPTESVAMQILHIHKTPEGLLVIVR